MVSLLCTVLRVGSVAQSVERAIPGEEVLGSIPAVAANTLLVGSVSIQCDWLRQKSWSPHSVMCVAALKIVRRQSWGSSAIIIAKLLTRTLRNQPIKQTSTVIFKKMDVKVLNI